MSKIYFIGLKKELFECYRMEKIRNKDNGTGLKEGGGIEMSTTVLSIHYNDNYNSIIENTINISKLEKKTFLR